MDRKSWKSLLKMASDTTALDDDDDDDGLSSEKILLCSLTVKFNSRFSSCSSGLHNKGLQTLYGPVVLLSP